jgi:hypothetical protein
MGTNDADNEFASDLVVANEDGSALERLEHIKQEILDIKGMAYQGTCPAGMSASQTAIVCTNLSDYGDDFFNTDWVMVVLHNVNSDGNSPEGEIRDITDYVSATGTFTTAAFGANVEAGDIVIVARRELFIIDGLTLKAAPVANSLAAFIASGGTALGQELPDSMSLIDILGNFTGPYDGVAADDNIKAILDVINAKTSEGIVVRQTIAFDGGVGSGAQGTVALFTVTGDVRVKMTAICSETIVGAGTLECGVSGNTAAIIAQIPDATALVADEIWFDATPTTTLDDDSSMPKKVVANGQDIILTIGTADLTDGTIKFVLEYEPLSESGAVVAA